MNRTGGRAVLALAAVLLATGCGTTTGGQPLTVGDVAGLPVTHFESGLRPTAPKPDVRVRGATGSVEDEVAIAAIADVSDYWADTMSADFQQEFEPVSALLSYDPEGEEIEVCGGTTADAAMNAFYCPPEDLVAWDRAMLLPLLRERFGPMAIVTVLGHEFGHAIQYRLGDAAGIDDSTSTIVKEQQADCFTGAYFRWMAEGKSKYFRVSTSEGINQVLGSLFFIRDEAGQSASDEGAHGSAFDRTYAFQLGFEKGAKRCAAIDQDRVDARITEEAFATGDSDGDAPINEEMLALLQQSLDQAFDRARVDGPRIVSNGGTCPDGDSTPPATYCAKSKTVSIDLDALYELGQPVDREAEFEGTESAGGLGDFAAFAEVASRYTQGIQKGVGADVDNANAGLRTACLVGAWARTTDPDTGSSNVLQLSPGDLDEAIAELMHPRSLIAADVDGHRVANGFARVEALRQGFLEGSEPCTKHYG